MQGENIHMRPESSCQVLKKVRLSGRAKAAFGSTCPFFQSAKKKKTLEVVAEKWDRGKGN